MTTGIQLALLGGMLIGAGVAMALWRLVPAQPDLADVINRYSASANRRSTDLVTAHQSDTTDRLGVWAIKRLPTSWWGKTPTRELALLGIPVYRHYGKKVTFALIGLLIVPMLTVLLTALAWSVPIVVPTIGSVVMAVVLFWIPDADVRADAARAREEFSRAMGAYIDLVALERMAGSGARQSMELASEVGDSWVFKRLGEELARSRWSGLAPWDALHGLADEMGLPDLDDLADIMRLSQEGAQVYASLRARSAGIRAAMLSSELAKANATGERMNMPMSLLGVVFMAIMIAPALLRVMGGGT